MNFHPKDDKQTMINKREKPKKVISCICTNINVEFSDNLCHKKLKALFAYGKAKLHRNIYVCENIHLRVDVRAEVTLVASIFILCHCLSCTSRVARARLSCHRRKGRVCTLDMSSDKHAHSHSRSPVTLTCLCLECGRKLKHPERSVCFLVVQTLHRKAPTRQEAKIRTQKFRGNFNIYWPNQKNVYMTCWT